MKAFLEKYQTDNNVRLSCLRMCEQSKPIMVFPKMLVTLLIVLFCSFLPTSNAIECPGCERAICVDCQGVVCNGYVDLVGDGTCNDGTYLTHGVHFDFNCLEFNYDKGDCADPTTTTVAPEYECTDCNGRNCTGHLSSLGDGFCDAWFDVSFNCKEYNFDEGDCNDLKCADCNGIDCTHYEKYIGDNYCDDGKHFFGHQMFHFNCDKFNRDDGDCVPHTTTTTSPWTQAPVRPEEVANCEGTWSDWSDCSRACGTGVHKRTYHIHQAAQNGGEHCLYENEQVVVDECNTLPCEAANECPASCTTCWEASKHKCHNGKNHNTEWKCQQHGVKGSHIWCDDASDHCDGIWSEYNDCSETCGGGEKVKFFRVEWPNTCGCDEYIGDASPSDPFFCVANVLGNMQCKPTQDINVRQLEDGASRDLLNA